MSEVHGSKLKITLDATDITSAFHRDDTEFGAGERDLIDNTNYGATADSHNISPIRKGIPIPIGGTWSTELHTFMQPLEGLKKALVVMPNGVAGGQPKLTGNVSITEYKIKQSVTGDSTWTAKLTPDDGLTWGSN